MQSRADTPLLGFFDSPIAHVARVRIAASIALVGAMACADAPPNNDDAVDTSSQAASTGVGSTIASAGPTTETTETTSDDGTSTSTSGSETSSGESSTSETDGAFDPPPVGLFACMIDDPCGRGTIGWSVCALDPTACPGTPEWTEADVCRLETAMAAAAGGITAELNAEGPNELSYLYDHDATVLRSNGTVFRQRYEIDQSAKTTTFYPVNVCALREPAWYQACIDTPSWQCAHEGSWYEACVEAIEIGCE